MKSVTHFIVGFLAAVSMLMLVSSAATAQDATKAAPNLYKALLENDRVRVMEYVSKPGEKAAMHTHPAHLGYIMSAGKAKFTTADGKSQEIEAKPGQVLWLEPTTHTVENVGTTELRVLVIDLKEPVMPPKK